MWAERFTGGSDEVTVNLGAKFPSVTLFDPTMGIAPVQSLINANSISLSLSNHPVIIEIAGPMQSGKGLGRQQSTNISN